MIPAKKYLLLISVVLLILSVFFVGGFHLKSSGDAYDNFFDNFDLEFKGVIVDIKYKYHDRAVCKIKVVKSNKTEYVDPKILWWDYCTLKNDTAYMELINGHVLELGDSIIIGPRNRFIAKFGNDTIVNFPKGKNKAYELERTKKIRNIEIR